jgi:hypothetical protein
MLESVLIMLLLLINTKINIIHFQECEFIKCETKESNIPFYVKKLYQIWTEILVLNIFFLT